MTITSNLTRRQLTLFVYNNNETIEKIRKEFNPVQYNLIRAHVTLCREDEIESIDKVLQNIKAIRLDSLLKIKFNSVDRFQNGKGVLIPANIENNEFNDLRKMVLKGIDVLPKQHQPHITLMHPRNSSCTEYIFKRIKQYQLPTELSFEKVSLIEQQNEGPWAILEEFKLKLNN